MRVLVALFLLPFCANAQVELIPAKVGTTSYVSNCFPIYSVADPNIALTGITGSTTSFKISMITDNQSTDTEFETTADIETIATIGTYAAPTANTDIRFGECPVVGHYQVQLHNDHLNVSGSEKITLTFEDGGNAMMTQTAYIYQDISDITDIEQAVLDVMTDLGLDHLVSAAVDLDTDVADDSIICSILGQAGDCSDYTAATDALSIASPHVFRGVCDSGSTTTCVDATLTEIDDFWRKGIGILFEGGNNDGLSSCVYDFTAADDTLYFRAMAGTTASGVFYLFPFPMCEAVQAP